jgi:hypothetical protein
MEGSVVTFPMNDKARLTGIKTVNPKTNFLFADRNYEWYASSAEERIREYTKSENEPDSTYNRYFMYFDSGRSKFFDAYKKALETGYPDIDKNYFTPESAVFTGIFADIVAAS